VEQALERMTGRVRAGDQLFVLLIGHGSATGGESRFNVPGPDITAADFARLLQRFGDQMVVFVNASSASGDFVKALSGPRRVVVTATKSPMERNESVFARHFVDAFAGDGADVDKDGRISVLEAFEYARREVARSYEEENRLQTEHALLDDNGDGVGTGAPDGKAPDGKTPDGGVARAIYLSAGRAVANASDPRIAALLKEKDALEARIAALRARKASMDSTAYERELEQLLVELATKNQAIRALEGRKP
jgi:hypothetical protein